MPLTTRQVTVYRMTADIWRPANTFSGSKMTGKTYSRIEEGGEIYFETGQSQKGVVQFIQGESDNLFTFDTLHMEDGVERRAGGWIHQTAGNQVGEWWQARGDLQVRNWRANKQKVLAARMVPPAGLIGQTLEPFVGTGAWVVAPAVLSGIGEHVAPIYTGTGAFLTAPAVLAGVGTHKALYLRDDFSDANGTNLHGKALDFGGVNWAVINNTMAVQGGRAVAGSGNNNAAIAEAGAADVEITANVHFATIAGSDYVGLTMRATSEPNRWLAILETSTPTATIYEVNGGAYTVRGQTAFNAVNDTTYALRLTAVGTSLALYVNSTLLPTYGSASFNQTATKHGIHVSQTSGIGTHWADDFQVTEP